jgi:hypothetical protein
MPPGCTSRRTVKIGVMRLVFGGLARFLQAALLALAVLCVLVLGVPAAWASLPVYEGGGFPVLHSASDPEEFSWEVELFNGQELRQIDEHEAAVFYGGGVRAFSIPATPAHDADGSAVPTTIQVTGEAVVTLIVHHRAGNPAAGGAPFVYPISAGVGWNGGFSTVIIQMPPTEQELREQQEREAREAAEHAAQAKRCRVPFLRGASLGKARHQLRRANCRLGSITKPRNVSAGSARVVGQTARPGSILLQGARVGVRLGLGDVGRRDQADSASA